MPAVNELYFVVLPQISLSPTSYGKVDEMLTLLPDIKMAAELSNEQAESLIRVFKNREKYFTGGTITGYEYEKIERPGGKFLVKVTQNVA